MTRAETSELMALIAEEHASFLNTPNPKVRLDLWHETFESLPYQLVEFAVKQTLKHKKDGYAPKLSDIVNCVKEAIKHDDDNAVAMWNLLAKTAARASRVTQEEFDALPYEVKSFCGNLAGLKSLGNNEEDIFNTVTRGQFMKIYDNLRNRREARESMPAEMLAIVQSLVPALSSPKTPKKHELRAPEESACPPPPEFENLLARALTGNRGQSAREGKPLTEDEFNTLRNERLAMLENASGRGERYAKDYRRGI